MDEKNNVPKPEQQVETVSPINAAPKAMPKTSMKIWIIAGVSLLLIAGGLVYFLTTRNNTTQSSDNTQAQSKAVTNFEECAVAGNPIQEIFPEVCVTPDGKSFVNKSYKSEVAEVVDVTAVASECDDTQMLFVDRLFGAAFCYPSAWGDANVTYAKIDDSDTGHREAVRFSATTKFIVGGVSEDWTTSVGRGVGCQEPSNIVPELSSYNVDWHNLVGEGMDIEFATRSLPTTVGGYDISETVSNLLDSGVCAQGHKVINGSRYKVISAAYYADFSTTAGVTTPKAHIDNPAILFTPEERAQLDLVLASVVSY